MNKSTCRQQSFMKYDRLLKDFSSKLSDYCQFIGGRAMFGGGGNLGYIKIIQLKKDDFLIFFPS